MSETIRPAATDTDKAIFDQLLKKMSAVDTYFCCGGTLELLNRPLSLYYRSADNATSNWLDFRGSSKQSAAERQAAIDKLLQACVPAPHGRGDETVLDESYRLARELRQDEFALSIEILSEAGSNILSAISSLTAGRQKLSEAQAEDQTSEEYYYRHRREKDTGMSVPDLIITPRLYKLNAYAKGGFFKPHRDTPKGINHIGTLMIALPTPHQGGILRVKHDEKEVLFNWGTLCSQAVQVSSDGELKISLPWAFLFSDVEHEVLPVEFGTRVTIAYDIFGAQEADGAIQGSPISNLDGSATPFYEDLCNILRNPSFLPSGAKVAIALSHAYPAVRGKKVWNSEEFASRLKGLDAIAYRAIKAAGFEVSLRAVMKIYDYKLDSVDGIPGVPKDGYGPEVENYGTFLITSQTFRHLDPDDYLDDFSTEVAKQYFGAEPSHELMWVKKPQGTYSDAGQYLAYSNEYSVEFFYSAAAFVIDVPAVGKGSRSDL